MVSVTTARGGDGRAAARGRSVAGASWWILARDIKLAHTVFAMPFALLAAALAIDLSEPAWRLGVMVGLVIACMVSARTFAMLVNRIADRGFDAQNPRTAGRALASGRVGVREAGLALVCSALLFFLAAAGFGLLGNAWPIALSPVVLGFLALYSYAKRVTWLCHVHLGIALALSPLATAIAVRPEALLDTPALWWLAGMVVCWVAGFDVIYALQDADVDRVMGLHSVPARLGVRAAAWLSRVLHALAVAMLVQAWRADGRLGVWFGGGIALVGALLVAEHVLLWRRGDRGLHAALFTVNGVVSCVLGLAGIVDVLAGA